MIGVSQKYKLETIVVGFSVPFADFPRPYIRRPNDINDGEPGGGSFKNYFLSGSPPIFPRYFIIINSFIIYYSKFLLARRYRPYPGTRIVVLLLSSYNKKRWWPMTHTHKRTLARRIRRRESAWPSSSSIQPPPPLPRWHGQQRRRRPDRGGAMRAKQRRKIIIINPSPPGRPSTGPGHRSVPGQMRAGRPPPTRSFFLFFPLTPGAVAAAFYSDRFRRRQRDARPPAFYILFFSHATIIIKIFVIIIYIYI